jgi:hypothetical protein
MFSVHEVNLQNPMPLLSFLVERTHRQMTIRVNIEGYFVIGDSLVGKFPNQMSRDRTAKLPAEHARLTTAHG